MKNYKIIILFIFFVCSTYYTSFAKYNYKINLKAFSLVRDNSETTYN